MRDTPCHAEEADRLTKHLLPMHTVEATDSSTPLRSAQNDTANLTTHPEVTHDVFFIEKAVAFQWDMFYIFRNETLRRVVSNYHPLQEDCLCRG